jgi:hypothetical protein
MVIVYFRFMQIAPLNVNTLEKLVLNKCESFVTMGVWPSGSKLQYRQWLGNFSLVEKEHALYLLNSFSYYNMDMCIALLRASFLNLSNLLQPSTTISQQIDRWNKLIADSVFIPVTGETKNVTDSGNLLAGYLRRDMLISQDNILTIDELFDSGFVSILKKFKHVIFFDDFVGSGQQFLTMWQEDFTKDSKFYDSVGKQCSSLNLKPHYCGMIGTDFGVNRIRLAAPEIDLHFSHIISEQMSPLHPNSIVWPDHLKSSAKDFIVNSSRRAGIKEQDIAGFHKLGLSIAFSFTIPDATLPIFRWNKSGWVPLMEKN